MSFYEKGAVRIYYEEAGSGFPLLVIPGGGLNSTIAGLKGSGSPFNPMEDFKGEYRSSSIFRRLEPMAGSSPRTGESQRPLPAKADLLGPFGMSAKGPGGDVAFLADWEVRCHNFSL